MAANSVFQPVNESGWRAGFGNLLRKESGDWWSTRRWWSQALIWGAVINGSLLSVLLTVGQLSDAERAAQDMSGGTLGMGLLMFSIMAGMFLALGAVLAAQGEILDEKKLGTAAWILSKPVSREAFMLSKLIANAFNMLVVMVLLPCGLAYAVFALTGNVLPIGPFVGALGLIWLHLLFYLTLTLMLGTLSEGRGAVIGLPLLILFGFQMILPVLPALGTIMPWVLITGVPNVSGAGFVVDVLSGQALHTLTPIIATAAWCVVFIIVAVWRFKREEF